ncbi:hypothetical protein CEXT_186421 [Caerostris extrusa]|uniref:Uncharacterized protein n=1 Tax=Caerostris extrusa TaxID=172846 RepID=A0AAV4VN30_CAEEX|nr:hypothetical protein CEXT_186421 [Caerostris extrusa]
MKYLDSRLQEANSRLPVYKKRRRAYINTLEIEESSVDENCLRHVSWIKTFPDNNQLMGENGADTFPPENSKALLERYSSKNE